MTRPLPHHSFCNHCVVPGIRNLLAASSLLVLPLTPTISLAYRFASLGPCAQPLVIDRPRPEGLYPSCVGLRIPLNFPGSLVALCFRCFANKRSLVANLASFHKLLKLQSLALSLVLSADHNGTSSCLEIKVQFSTSRF